MTLTFHTETTHDGVVDRSFTVDGIPGVLWSPADPVPGAPLLLMGHGGGLHKRAAGLAARAHQAVTRDGFHVAAIDAPGHGDRIRSRQDEQWVDELFRARSAGESPAALIAGFNASLADRAVPEWQATIDAVLALPGFDATTPIGYAGMTLASAIGIPLAAAESRVRAAIFGGVFVSEALLEAARRVSVPVEFLVPWDDDELDRRAGFELFDAFGSTEKTLLAFPGSHFHVPAARLDTGFFARTLRPPVAA